MTTSMNGHPTDAELMAWLDDATMLDIEVESPTTSHVNLCERCATVIERLAGDTPSAPETDDRIRSVLTDAVAPPADLAQRLRSRIDERERTKGELNTVLRLFGLPSATMNAMSTSRSRRRPVQD